MRSRISCFNKTLFFKNISRFWPIWATYLGIWCLILPLPILSAREYYAETPLKAEDYVLNSAHIGGIAMTAVFAVLMAMAVWSFLYSARAAHGAACLPVRREGLFVSAALGGLVPLAAANVAVFLLTLAAESAVGCLNAGVLGQWLGAVTMQLVFFYGFACFCAQLTGSIVVLPLLYGVLNFVVYGVTQLGRALLSLFLYGADVGMGFSMDFSAWFSPVLVLAGQTGPAPVTARATDGSWDTIAYTFEGWGVLAIYAALGVAFGAGALLLLRRRRMESAGDVVAVQVLKPIFRWCMALGCALCFTCLILVIGFAGGEMRSQMKLFIAVLLLLLAGAFIGWFGAEMLLKKSFRVFGRHWGSFGFCCLALLALMLCTELDVVGFERRVPATAEVESVTIVTADVVTLAEPESIDLVRAFHEDVVAHKAQQDQGGSQIFFDQNGRTLLRCELKYQLRNGSEVSRGYYLPYEPGSPSGTDAEALQQLVNCPEAISDRKRTRIAVSEETLVGGSVRSVMRADECAAAAGCPDAVEYILGAAYGLAPTEVRALDERERNRLVNGYVLDCAWNSGVFLSELYDEEGPATYEIGSGSSAAPDAYLFDLSQAYFEYVFPFSNAEILDLYRSAVAEDIADGTLGRLWILEGDTSYDDGVYHATVELSLRTVRPDGKEDYEFFSSTPTADSVRTTAWLEAHGVVMHTVGELR